MVQGEESGVRVRETKSPCLNVMHGGFKMLVLSRLVHEKVVVTLPDGREMEVVVVEIARGKVRLGFAAPKDVKIMRPELLGERGEVAP